MLNFRHKPSHWHIEYRLVPNTKCNIYAKGDNQAPRVDILST